MMKFKKFASIMLVAVMTAATLAGCGSKTTESPAGQEATPEGEAADTEASSGETFKIGGIGPTTGGAAVYGKAVANGAQIAVDEINAAGGINGVQVELKFEDDEHDPEKAVNAYNALKDWGMQALLGTVTSGPCIAVVDKTAQDNMYQLTPSATAVDAIKHDNAFRVCFSDPNQGAASAAYIADQNLASKIAVIYDSSDTYSTGIYETFLAEAAEKGLEIVAAEAFTAESKNDFSVQLQKAKDAEAELVFLPFYYQEASLVLKQAHEMGYAPTFFGCDGMDGILAVDKFDTSLADGVKFLAPFSSTAEDELTVNFVAAYQAAHNEVPNQFAADAYDGIYIMKAAMEHANVTPEMTVSDICEAMKAAMLEIKVNGVTAKELTWDASGEPQKEPMVLEIRDGAYTVL
jgi:ABC-type branched-chain amino acid transport systems, periplasmic component